MGNFIDLTGQVFGRLTAISRSENKGKITKWKCRCVCGNISNVQALSLRNGTTKSCGCLQKDSVSKASRRHGLAKHRFYKTWHGMKARCYDIGNSQFENYGGRGIVICDDWLNDISEFLSWCDRYEASNGKIQNGYSIDRIDNNGNYSPENCRFANSLDQILGRRTTIWIKDDAGSRLCLKHFVEKYGYVSYSVALVRVRNGMDPKDAALTPP